MNSICYPIMPRYFILTFLCFTLGLCAAEGPFSVDQLQQEHPMILASASDFTRLRNGLPDELGQDLLAFLQNTGESLFTAEPAQYELAGIRLLAE